MNPGVTTNPDHVWDPADYAANAAAQRAWARELMGQLALRGDERVLDVGCGDGAMTVELAALLPRGHVLGVDASEAMIAHARRHYGGTAHPRVSFAVMDARRLTVAVAVDIVFSNAALHWVDDHRAFLQGAAGALRPGGRLVVSCGGRGNAEDVFRSVRAVMRDRRWRERFRGMARPYHFYGPGDYAHWLWEAGLRPVRVQLTPRAMIQPSAEAFAGWLRTTWLPYTQRVPAGLRDDFVGAVTAHYLKARPAEATGVVRAEMVRLEIIAEKDREAAREPAWGRPPLHERSPLTPSLPNRFQRGEGSGWGEQLLMRARSLCHGRRLAGFETSGFLTGLYLGSRPALAGRV